MRRRTRIVLGSLTGLVAVPTFLGLTAVLVRDLRGAVFAGLGVPLLVVGGAMGVVLGGVIAGHMELSTRGASVFGVFTGGVIGAVALGFAFLGAAVVGEDWPDGLQAFLTGSIVGAVVGGSLGGLFGSVTPQEIATSRRDASATSRREAR